MTGFGQSVVLVDHIDAEAVSAFTRDPAII